jgi:hypothetical protein
MGIVSAHFNAVNILLTYLQRRQHLTLQSQMAGWMVKD